MSTLSSIEIRYLKRECNRVIPRMAYDFATHMGVKYNRICIKKMKSRWGSCSSKGNLNFNCILILAPKEIVEYVVVHELCHLKEMNHSSKFWAEVEQVMPDYKERRQWLKMHGNDLILKVFA